MQEEAQQAVDNFCADVVNAVQDYCDDGIDAFESCLDSAPQLDDQTRQVVTQGAAALHQDLASKVASSLSLFVELCKSHVAAPPLPINLPQEPQAAQQDGDSDLTALHERQAQLDQRLASLRAQITQEDQECSRLAGKLKDLDTQLQLYGNLSSLQAASVSVAGSGAPGERTLAADVAAIVEAQTRLQPLLGKAKGLAAQQAAQNKTPGLLRTGPQARTLLGSLDNVAPFP